MCTHRAGNLGNVLVTSRNPPKYFYQWYLDLVTFLVSKTVTKLHYVIICTLWNLNMRDSEEPKTKNPAILLKYPRIKCFFHIFISTVKSQVFNTSHVEAHAGFFRCLMKGIFDPFVSWPSDKKLISYTMMRVSSCYYTVFTITSFGPKWSAMQISNY